MIKRFIQEYILALIIVMSCMTIFHMAITYKTFVLCFIITLVYEIRWYFTNGNNTD